MRKHTLLLCFIHGFKGDDDTFGDFPNHLRVLLQNARPHLNVAAAVYPRYETRGELPATVARFREWLQNRVIDLEVGAGTASPTVDPSVHTVLVGHSMGGIVAADTLLAILDDEPVSGDARLPFPHIAGVLAFDTPYLGLAPSLFANSADQNLRSASAAFSQLSGMASGLFASRGAAAAAAADSAVVATRRDASKSPEREKPPQNAAAEPPQWQRWGKVAALGGAAVALAGGAAAAYMKRDDLTRGFGWVSSHLEFVGVLMKPEELKKRAARTAQSANVGFANVFTSLGDRKGSPLFDGKERTFCNLPPAASALAAHFHRAVNPRARDEVDAHVGMFRARTNPGYYDMADAARNLVVQWVPADAWAGFADGGPGAFEPTFGSAQAESDARESVHERASASATDPNVVDLSENPWA